MNYGFNQHCFKQTKLINVVLTFSISLLFVGCGSDDDAAKDTTPPSFSGVTSVNNAGATNLVVSWSAATDDTTATSAIRYRIYADADINFDPQNPGMPNATAVGVTEFTVRDLAPGTTYNILVEAVDEAGNSVIESAPYQPLPATLDSVSFSLDLQPLFEANCTNANCHGADNPNRGLVLTDAQTSYENLLGQNNGLVDVCTPAPAFQPDANNPIARPRITPNDSSWSELVNKLDPDNSANICAGVYMPKSADPISVNMYNALVMWIDAGALNN